MVKIKLLADNSDYVLVDNERVQESEFVVSSINMSMDSTIDEFKTLFKQLLKGFGFADDLVNKEFGDEE